MGLGQPGLGPGVRLGWERRGNDRTGCNGHRVCVDGTADLGPSLQRARQRGRFSERDRGEPGRLDAIRGTMLREHAVPFCDYAHAIIGHYKSVEARRWFRKYPYERPG